MPSDAYYSLVSIIMRSLIALASDLVQERLIFHDEYNSFRLWLKLLSSARALLRVAGMEVLDAAPSILSGLSLVAGPRVMLSPSFAVGVGDVVHKVV